MSKKFFLLFILMLTWMFSAAGPEILFCPPGEASDAEPSYEVDYERAGGYNGPSQKGPASGRRTEDPHNYRNEVDRQDLFTSPGETDFTGRSSGKSRFFGVYGPDKVVPDEDDG